ALHIGDVGAAGGQHRELLIAEIGTDPAHHVDLIEERGGQREVRRGAAEHALALAERRLDRVEGDRADDRDAHAWATSGAPRPAAARSASALSVRSHVKSASSRPKCPYAAVFW